MNPQATDERPTPLNRGWNVPNTPISPIGVVGVGVYDVSMKERKKCK